jgi:hypothetical protein
VVCYGDLLPITNMQRKIAPMMTSGSPAEAGVVGVTQTTPHPPGHPLPAGGQVYVPPVGQGGGVQTMVGVTHTTPHPPGQPFPSGGQERDPPGEQGGGVQTTVTEGAGVETTATADTGTQRTKRRMRARFRRILFSILFIVPD